MITCHNCHFDNEAGACGALKAKFFSGKFGGTVASGNSWRYLVNRVMPDGSTKVYRRPGGRHLQHSVERQLRFLLRNLHGNPACNRSGRSHQGPKTGG